MNIAICGCGWLGLPLGKALVTHHYNVAGSTTQTDKLNDIKIAGIRPHLISVTNNGIDGDTSFFNCDTLIITLPFKRSFTDPSTYQRQINHILNATSASWIIFTSSTSVYSDDISTATENMIISPKTDRQRALLDTENTIQNHPTPSTILRLGGLIGKTRQPGKFLAGKSNIPNTPVNLIHLDTLIDIIIQIIKADLKNNIFNIVSDEHPTKREYYAPLCKKMGLPLPTFIEATGKVVDNSKIKGALEIDSIPLR